MHALIHGLGSRHRRSSYVRIEAATYPLRIRCGRLRIEAVYGDIFLCLHFFEHLIILAVGEALFKLLHALLELAILGFCYHKFTLSVLELLLRLEFLSVELLLNLPLQLLVLDDE